MTDAVPPDAPNHGPQDSWKRLRGTIALYGIATRQERPAIARDVERQAEEYAAASTARPKLDGKLMLFLTCGPRPNTDCIRLQEMGLLPAEARTSLWFWHQWKEWALEHGPGWRAANGLQTESDRREAPVEPDHDAPPPPYLMELFGPNALAGGA